MNRISQQQVVGPADAQQTAVARPAGNQGTGFKELLHDSIAAVNSSMVEADNLVQGLARGQHANIHETMIALEKANVSFRLLTRVQQKAIDAYREIMRLQL